MYCATKKCEKCGDEFISNSNRQRYCSADCREHVRNRRNRKRKPQPYKPTPKQSQTCERCGIEFIDRKKRFCSRECLVKSRNKSLPEKPCCRCGEHFRPTGERHVCCKACRPEATKERVRERYASGTSIECDCKGCGKAFKPKVSNRTSFCTRECCFGYLKKHGLLASSIKEKIRNKQARAIADGLLRCLSYRASQSKCRVCDKWSPWVSCSSECRKADARRYALSTGRLPFNGTCATCGCGYERKLNGRSDKCPACVMETVRAGRRKQKKKWSKQNVRRCGDRCHWTCHICDGPIDSTLRHPHLLSGEVDHIEPRRIGGNSRANKHIAHRCCNHIKSDGSWDEARRMVALMLFITGSESVISLMAEDVKAGGLLSLRS